MVEDVEELGAELDTVPFFEFEVFEHGEIHGLEPRVAEDIPAHVAELAQAVWSHDRIAAGGRKATGGQ
jgi:hypothetical protein